MGRARKYEEFLTRTLGSHAGESAEKKVEKPRIDTVEAVGATGGASR